MRSQQNIFEMFYRALGERTPGAPRRFEIVDADEERVLHTLTMPADTGMTIWAWSNDALLGAREIEGVRSIWRVPIDGQPPVQVTSFGPAEFDGGFAYTADGARLFFFREERAPGEVLQFRNWR